MPDDADTVESDGTEVFERRNTNNLIHAEVNFPQGDKIQGAQVIGCSK